MSIERQIPGNPVSVPPRPNLYATNEYVDFLNQDSEAVTRMELQTVVLQDIERNVGLVVGHNNQLFFPTDKDYHGGISAVKQPAYILIKKNNGYSDEIVAATNKFFITQWQETHMEKVQVIETFHSSTINWFDEKTKSYSVGGVLLDGERTISLLDSDVEDVKHTYLWGQSFRKLWDTRLRGTKLEENQEICMLTILNNVLYGYPIALSLTTNANIEHTIQFQFQFLCTRHIILGNKLSESYDPATNQRRMWQNVNTNLLQNFINMRNKLEEVSNAQPVDYTAIDNAQKSYNAAYNDLLSGTATGEDNTSSWLQFFKASE
ncbi:MAG: hypothetical protein ACP5N7_03550 [Candidatus Pacearchaeota archaeon]